MGYQSYHEALDEAQVEAEAIITGDLPMVDQIDKELEAAVWPHGDGTLVQKDLAALVARGAALRAYASGRDQIREATLEPFKVYEFIDDEVATLLARISEKIIVADDSLHNFLNDEITGLANEVAMRIVMDRATMINSLSAHCHAASTMAGWWTDINTGESLVGKRNVGELMMLMVSEIAEGFEGVRKNLPSEKLPGFSNEEEEMADLLIRLGDFAGARKLRLGEAVIAKMQYNATREDHKIENRRKADGKKF